ncbi:hypothetical protein GO755_14425 [Spirosoma sp. HMF4905]|uniref:Uncharacterized protein n=1 Tax=Spirosoma arboris TaxID=2682092 RepID=A0A7K1SBT7_9BACT|nr:hypothetical protein [Spirosoma arboris]MVM31235.1 hypothetical protein [Spirosoma arboris]
MAIVALLHDAQTLIVNRVTPKPMNLVNKTSIFSKHDVTVTCSQDAMKIKEHSFLSAPVG